MVPRCRMVGCRLFYKTHNGNLNENENLKKREVRSKDGKLILRDLMSRYVAQSSGSSEGVKQGFSAPDASWFRGESLDYVKTKLFNKYAKLYSYFDYEETTTHVQSHLDGHSNKRLYLWSLLYLEELLERFKM